MIHVLSPLQEGFEDVYLQVRRKENRIYTIDEIRKLPWVKRDHLHAAEWKVRKKSLRAFIGYLESAHTVKRLLEVGCGNGWFAANVARALPEIEVVGCDLNLYELKQAEEAFTLPNLSFVYGDVMEEWPPEFRKYDLVVLPSSVQYFHSFPQLIHRLLKFAPEVHIIDTHFYTAEEVGMAIKRTKCYFYQLGYPHMADKYFHHTLNDLKPFNHQYLYRPPTGWRKVMGRSPFPWIKIQKS